MHFAKRIALIKKGFKKPYLGMQGEILEGSQKDLK
jgi:hypothetical protein